MRFVKISSVKAFAFSIILAFILISGPTIVKADPGNCEDCFNGPEELIQDCLDSFSCNTVPVNGNLWVLGIAGLVLAFVVYRKRFSETE